MKHGKHGQSFQIIQQLKGSKCFVDYCRSIGQIFFGQHAFLDESVYQHRYVSVKSIRSRKHPTFKPQGTSLHDCPEQMLKISDPPDRGIQFNELIKSPH